eukprot:scaffold2423_cov113-Isochrysis_galbana.AAC.6
MAVEAAHPGRPCPRQPRVVATADGGRPKPSIFSLTTTQYVLPGPRPALSPWRGVCLGSSGLISTTIRVTRAARRRRSRRRETRRGRSWQKARSEKV